MKLLLWNIQQKVLTNSILSLVHDHRVDFVVLVEWYSQDSLLSSVLQQAASLKELRSPERFGVFVPREADAELVLWPMETNRACMWHIRFPDSHQSLHLVTVHGYDRVNTSAEYRGLFFERLRESIELVERQSSHDRTIVVGDFNENPFDAAISSIRGLHAVPVTDVGGRSYRTVQNRRHSFFHNPMWRCYGRENAPLASYYHNSSDVHEIFWHMLDQVVIRPSLVSCLPQNPVEILSSVGEDQLLNSRGQPDKNKSSDHLPILLTLELTEDCDEH